MTLRRGRRDGGRGQGVTRRAMLAGTGTLALGLAGCLGLGGTDSTNVDCSSSLPQPVRGDPNADVTVAAFEDYACPHCQHYVLEILPSVVENYTDPGRIRYEHWDFPIPVRDPESWTAANAARAVQEDAGVDAFWTYSTQLYRNQASLSPDTYASLAEDVGADPQFVRGAARERCYDDMLKRERQTGLDRGLEGTPTVYVGQKKLTAPSYDELANAINAALQ